MSALERILNTSHVGDIDRVDLDVIAMAGCSLDMSPGKNWVEKQGGLPEYICEIARAIMRGGTPRSRAIAIAVSRVKRWAVDPTKNADTRAKAAKAIAEWEAKKAKSHAKTAAKKIAASFSIDSDINNVLVLSNMSFPVDVVRNAFDEQQRKYRLAYRAKNPFTDSEDVPRLRLVELWSDHVIASDGYNDGAKLYRVNYTVDVNHNVVFGEMQEVVRKYIPVGVIDNGPSDSELEQLMATQSPCGERVAMSSASGRDDANLVLQLAALNPTPEERKRWASEGVAMPDGSYPIPTVVYLRAAIRSYGRAKPEDRGRVRAHIKKRARALGRADLIPEGW